MLRLVKSAAVYSFIKKRLALVAMLLIASICAATLLFRTVNTFTLSDGENTHKIRTLSNDVETAMDMVGFGGDKYKVLSVNVAGTATHVDVAYTFPVYITVGYETTKVNVTETTVADILSDAGYTVDKYDMVEPSLDTVVAIRFISITQTLITLQAVIPNPYLLKLIQFILLLWKRVR